MALTEKQAIALVDKTVASFNKGKLEFFNNFAQDAVVFLPNMKDPVKGRKAFQQAFTTMVGSEGEEKVLDRSVHILGDKAVVTQSVQLMLPTQTLQMRQTMIVGDTSDGLKVLHFQSSLTSPGSQAQAISVVNERIAVVAPVLGVAQ
jgi:ketosteroid isomerase-like protein